MGIGEGWYEHEWRALRLGCPKAGDPPRHAAEGVRDHAPALDDGTAHPRTAELYQCQRRDLPAAAAPGRGVRVDRRRRGEEDLRIRWPRTPATPNFRRNPTFPPQVRRFSAEHAARSARTTTRSTRSVNYKRDLARLTRGQGPHRLDEGTPLLRCGVPENIQRPGCGDFHERPRLVRYA